MGEKEGRRGITIATVFQLRSRQSSRTERKLLSPVISL